jgi:Fic family protein
MDTEEIEFLQQSNYIEGVLDGLDDSVKAWKYLKNQDFLTEEIICKAHKLLMKNQNIDKKDKGAFRTCNVRVGNRICPDYRELKPLMWKWLFESIRKNPLPDDKQLHIIFEKIHPFVDGNGRIGRMLMNWIRIKRLSKPILIIREEDRFQYYEWFKD